ncbi:glycine cleavage system protein H [Candidatus Peregrinibacteria bacterium CG10_big_fil_rev_8_21_14_0_10_54_7]|nr:MAG: glycine cleavage system protein H [Candidatus Peregrinibacteria bacterium CG10_big_fil_rev_8_21_14_0_10_54_7]
MDGLKYTKDHEWIKVKGDTGTVGITDFAQHSLTDIVFAELPQAGKVVEQGKAAMVVESVKSVSDVFAPVSGEITEVNEGVGKDSSLINKDPYGEGWLFKLKVKDASELEKLMDAEAYRKYLAEQAH